MTRNEMLAEIGKVRNMPFAILSCTCQVSGEKYERELTYDQYMDELRRAWKPWTGHYGDEANFNDEKSEKAEKEYYKERKRVRELLREYNSTHKQQLKL